MRRGRWFSAVVASAFLALAAGESLAQRGGRGGSSFGGGSRGGMSGSSSSGRSYGGSSSGSRSTPAPSSRPAAPSSSGRSYGGSSSSPSTSTSTAPGGGSSGRTYGPSAGTYTPPRAPSGGSSVRPSVGTASTSAQQRTESRVAFQKAAGPRDTYRNASGKTVPIGRSNPAQNAENDRLRGQLNASRMETRSAREDAAYYRWRSQPPYYYNDPFHMNFSNLFLTWALIDQARYLSRHDSLMDQERVNRLYAENAQLRDEVAKVKKDGVPPDWKEPIDPDLAYSDDYVAAVAGYETVRPSAAGGALADHRPGAPGSTLEGFFKLAFWGVVVASAAYLLYYAVFKYKF